MPHIVPQVTSGSAVTVAKVKLYYKHPHLDYNATTMKDLVFQNEQLWCAPACPCMHACMLRLCSALLGFAFLCMLGSYLLECICGFLACMHAYMYAVQAQLSAHRCKPGVGAASGHCRHDLVTSENALNQLASRAPSGLLLVPSTWRPCAIAVRLRACRPKPIPDDEK